SLPHAKEERASAANKPRTAQPGKENAPTPFAAQADSHNKQKHIPKLLTPPRKGGAGFSREQTPYDSARKGEHANPMRGSSRLPQ
ncbi:MAG: hypothetical protein KKE53_19160, partial [Proteobacteria bacterium]|nr:hypothetical protein [Pseudomonadota bacterium]